MHSTQYTAQYPAPPHSVAGAGSTGLFQVPRLLLPLSLSPAHTAQRHESGRPLIGQWWPTRALIGPAPLTQAGLSLASAEGILTSDWLPSGWTKTAPPGSHWPRCPRDWTLHNPGTLTSRSTLQRSTSAESKQWLTEVQQSKVNVMSIPRIRNEAF